MERQEKKVRKGEQTRQFIIMKSAEIFNQRGYSGSSLNEIMDSTGLKKGGIYCHFASKDELAFEAFDYAIQVMRERFREAVSGKSSARDKLLALLAIYTDVVNNPPLKGGCPMLNTAVESDDAHPGLRERAQKAMAEWLAFIKRIIQRGIKAGEFHSQVDADALASFVTSLIEGGVMMCKLDGDNRHMHHNMRLLQDYLELVCMVRRDERSAGEV